MSWTKIESFIFFLHRQKQKEKRGFPNHRKWSSELEVKQTYAICIMLYAKRLESEWNNCWSMANQLFIFSISQYSVYGELRKENNRFQDYNI